MTNQLDNKNLMDSHSMEIVFQIWNDKTGERIEVGPDRDGLDLIEIRSYTDDNKPGQFIVLTKEQARLVLSAISQTIHCN